MPFHFTCPHCGSATLVDDQYSGQSGPCVACSKPVQLPNFATAKTGAAAGSVPRTGNRPLSKGIRLTIAAVIAIGFAGGLFIAVNSIASVAQRAQVASSRGRCLKNMQKIAAALNAYAVDYGTYPPPHTVDATGKPMLSWRVLILPYLGYEDLYKKFDLKSSWDATQNIDFIFECPEEYVSPADYNSTGDTCYFLVTGPGTLFPPTGPLSPKNVADGLTETLLVVESARPPSMQTQWTKPIDLDVTRMGPVIGGSPGVEMGGNHQGGATAATADGRGVFLKDNLTPTILRALITPQGGEAIPDDTLD